MIRARFALAILALSAASWAQTPAAEQGTFRLHKFEAPIGTETWTVRRDGDVISLESDFKFTDRGTAVPLKASLRASADWTPEKLEIKGRTSRMSAMNRTVEVAAGEVHVVDGKKTTTEPRPERFFASAGYAPVAMQMALLRYWLAHGSPSSVRVIPIGDVRIEKRGSDEIGSEKLDRYSVAGLIWGRETVWLDRERRVAALVSIDAEFDHFEAVREGLESSLPKLVGIASRDSMAALAELAAGRRTAASGVTAIVHARLIDGTGAAPMEDATVVIEGDRIKAAGPGARVKIPKDANIIDGSGKTLLPGLWDMHAHFEQVEWGPIYLAAGVTTVRDCGNEFEYITAVRDAIREGRGIGPTLLLAGIVDGDGPQAIGVDRVNNPEQAREWVKRYDDAGFQQMKIYSSMTKDNVAAVATDAHKLGMTVTGHVPNGMTTEDAVAAGMDGINHIQYIAVAMLPKPVPSGFMNRMAAFGKIDVHSPEAASVIELLKAHRTVVDPTLALMEMRLHSSAHPYPTLEPGVRAVPPELASAYSEAGAPPAMGGDMMEAAMRKFVEIVGALHKAGIPVVAGTDQAVPGYSVYREIELYAQAGFTPMQAIQAATIVPARAMKVDKETGTVEPGKIADLILVDGNPLADIHQIRNVRTVVARGAVYDSEPLWRSVGFRPELAR